MRLSAINATYVLKTKLDDYLVTTTIYHDGQRPTNGLPSSFVEINENGAVSTISSKFGIMEQNLLVTINTELLSNGAYNEVKDKLIFDAFCEIFKQPLVEGYYNFEMAKDGMFSKSRNIIAGYGTRFLNIKVTIKN